MEILSMLQENGESIINGVLDLVTIILVILNRPKTAEQVQEAKRKKIEKLKKKNDKKVHSLQSSINQQKELEEELKK